MKTSARLLTFRSASTEGSLSLSDTHVRMLEDYIQETILEQNKLAAGEDRSVSADK